MSKQLILALSKGRIFDETLPLLRSAGIETVNLYAGFVALAPDALSPLGGYPGTDEKGVEMQRTLDGAKLVEDWAARDIPVIATDRDARALGMLSRHARPHVLRDPVDDPAGFIADLETLGRTLPAPGVLFPTHDEAIEVIGPHEAHLSTWFHMPWTPWADLQPYVDKAGQHAAAHRIGFPVPVTVEPVNEADVRAAILGLSRGSTLAHIARAGIEAMALQSFDLIDAMNRSAVARGNTPLRELRVDGGAAVNDTLMQWQADLLGIPVLRPRITETTALGAAWLAGLGVGLWADLQQLEPLWQLERRFDPQRSRSWAQETLARWHHAVAQVCA